MPQTRKLWLWGVVSVTVPAYSLRMHRLWVCLPATETVAIEGAARPPRVMARKGPTVLDQKEA